MVRSDCPSNLSSCPLTSAVQQSGDLFHQEPGDLCGTWSGLARAG